MIGPLWPAMQYGPGEGSAHLDGRRGGTGLSASTPSPSLYLH
jgi:hypothetical protein